MREINEKIKVIIIVFIFYFILFSLGITCPIKYLTGISCPGCGMTRAWISIFHLQLAEAFSYHPLFFLAPILMVGVIHYDKYRCCKWISVIIGILFICVYILRLTNGNENIVDFNPKDGVMFKVVEIIIMGG